MSVNGMDKNLYIGEDHDFFYRINEKFKNLKVYFAKNVFVYHYPDFGNMTICEA